MLAVHGVLREHARIETEDPCVVLVVALAVKKLTESCLRLDKETSELLVLQLGFARGFFLRLLSKGIDDDDQNPYVIRQEQ